VSLISYVTVSDKFIESESGQANLHSNELDAVMTLDVLNEALEHEQRVWASASVRVTVLLVIDANMCESQTETYIVTGRTKSSSSR
jgi:predicted deacylase